MQYRVFGRTKWRVSEIGYGMWGMAGWTGSDDEESRSVAGSRRRAGLQFLRHRLGLRRRQEREAARELLRRYPDKRLHVATKIPPKNRQWPARPQFALDEVFPPDYMREYTEISLKNLGVETIDLQQLHVWTDEWADDDRWQKAVASLKEEGPDSRLRHQHQPVAAGERAQGPERPHLIDSVQVVYNVFDQNPEDELFPECERRNIAVIARVPFDEGSLTGTLTADVKLARRRLPQHLFPARESSHPARASGTSAAAGAGRHESSGAGAASYPAYGSGEHRNPGHAQAATRRSKPQGQRQRRGFARQPSWLSSRHTGGTAG